MMPQKLLLCTDLDRTLIPNGEFPDNAVSRKRFAEFCALEQVRLVYVTGRHKKLVQEAIQEYDLPIPDYAITDVGTKIYHVQNQEWSLWEDWREEISTDWNGWTNMTIRQLLKSVSLLKAQEEDKQSRYKLSYYVTLPVDDVLLKAQIEAILELRGIKASLIWSVDDIEQVGLLDILPARATKLHGIKFLQKQLGYSQKEVFFSGDSGNDLPVLSSDVLSVLVANASEIVRYDAQTMAASAGNESTLFLASIQGDRHGNYVDGIMQGLEYFEFCNRK